jgi:predicted hotdog family 3-hydroxylacyl-ACP dehydratase
VRLSLVFYVFLARMALGTLVSLVVVWAVRPAERHVRFQAILTLCLAGGAAALYLPALGDAWPQFPRGARAFLSLEGGMPQWIVLVALCCLLVNLFFGLYRRRAGRAAIVLGILAGVLAVLGTARFSEHGQGATALAVLTLGGILGGLLIAAVNDAMLLGHAFLMVPGLPVGSLRRAGLFTAGVVLARLLLLGGVLLFWDGALARLLDQALIWFSWRVAFGLLGPLVLLWMVKDTVRLENTQAATGLLYVAVAFALLGELAAVYLELELGIPV